MGDIGRHPFGVASQPTLVYWNIVMDANDRAERTTTVYFLTGNNTLAITHLKTCLHMEDHKRAQSAPSPLRKERGGEKQTPSYSIS